MPALATPTIVVNSDTIPIKANSFTYTEGRGTRIVRSQSTGGGASSTVITQDAETLYSMCKFTLITTDTSVSNVKTWLDNLDSNLIEVMDKNFARTFQNAIIVNESEINLGAEGEIEVEFQSKPAV